MIQTFRSWAILHRMAILLVVLNLYDFVSTKIIVDIAGPTAEVNPAMRWVIEEYTIWGILWFKIAALLVIWGLCTLTTKNGRVIKPHNAHIVIGILCIPLLTVCLWNTFVIYQVISV